MQIEAAAPRIGAIVTGIDVRSMTEEDWKRLYGGNLLIVLPDAFGTAAFLRNAPDWVADWTGFRPDSAPPIEGGEKIIDWWKAHDRDPREKLLIFSDGMDVATIEDPAVLDALKPILRA